MREHGTLHVPDVRAQNDFPTLGSRRRLRTFLAVPLRQQGELIGTLIARRIEVRPFTPAQIKLLETFADQAVIAIENVRLFQELKESLEQQTATSEILGVIASSPTDIQPVLDISLRMRRGCAMQRMRQIRPSRRGYASPSGVVRINGQCRIEDRSADQSWLTWTGEPLSIGKRFIFMILRRSRDRISGVARTLYERLAFGRFLLRHCCAKGRDRSDCDSPHRRFVHSPKSKSLFSKLLPTKR